MFQTVKNQFFNFFKKSPPEIYTPTLKPAELLAWTKQILALGFSVESTHIGQAAKLLLNKLSVDDDNFTDEFNKILAGTIVLSLAVEDYCHLRTTFKRRLYPLDYVKVCEACGTNAIQFSSLIYQKPPEMGSIKFMIQEVGKCALFLHTIPFNGTIPADAFGQLKKLLPADQFKQYQREARDRLNLNGP